MSGPGSQFPQDRIHYDLRPTAFSLSARFLRDSGSLRKPAGGDPGSRGRSCRKSPIQSTLQSAWAEDGFDACRARRATSCASDRQRLCWRCGGLKGRRAGSQGGGMRGKCAKRTQFPAAGIPDRCAILLFRRPSGMGLVQKELISQGTYRGGCRGPKRPSGGGRTERPGFEPGVEVYPLRQFSKLLP